MTEPGPSAVELLRRRIPALYRHDDRSRIEAINEWTGGIAPRFYLGRTTEGSLWRFRSDLPDELVEALETLCTDAPAAAPLARTPLHHDEYVRLLSSHAPVERVWAGPAYRFPAEHVPSAAVIAIDEGNADLLRGGFEAWLPDVPHRRPFLAALEDGRAVSVCASVRITDAVHCAGVETLPAHRRRGHAVNVVAAWAAAVRQIGAVPLYSTSWDNTASRQVARRLGLSMFCVDFHVT